ncbi:MFS transporter [Haloimpatiens sp. FM7315]|uniref:MFS transporter n=1 Tax=Haloimpatiens sp. FM7315 TaxID=3298609 RepID=UPI00370A1979
MKNKKTIVMIFFIFLLMIMNAIAENLRGILIPVFKNEFAVNDTSIGIMLFIGSLGYVVSTFVGGFLCEKIGQKKVLVFGLIFMIMSLGIFFETHVFYGILIAMFLMNVGLGLTSIAVNTLIPVLLLSFQAILMNVTHFCYGLGASIGPKIGGDLIYKGMSWRYLYLFIAILFLALLFVFIFVKIPSIHKVDKVNSEESKEVDKSLLFYYVIALGFYVCAEGGTGSWLVNYLKNVYKYNEAKSATFLAIFFGALTLGRLLGGLVVEKFGYVNTIIKSLLIASVLYLAGLILGGKYIYLVSVSGAFFAITYPTTILTVSKVFKEKTSFLTGIIVTVSTAIYMVMNVVIGKLNDTIGYETAFYIIPLCLLISILFMSVIHVKTKHILVRRSEK